MRIITEAFLKDAAMKHPRAATALVKWADIVKEANWATPVELAQSFSSIDPVIVNSGHTVYVCNIRGNEFRLIIAVHFDKGRVYTLRFLTHAEYDALDWKDEL
jgi:mRNA interferase HigB